MRKITRESLDELGRTMSIIPASEMIRFLAGEVGKYSNRTTLTNYLNSWLKDPNYVELVLISYYDGSYDIYKHPDNSKTKCYYPQFEFISCNTCPGGRQYYYNKHAIYGIGHTHHNEGVISQTDLNAKAAFSGLDHYIYHTNFKKF